MVLERSLMEPGLVSEVRVSLVSGVEDLIYWNVERKRELD